MSGELRKRQGPPPPAKKRSSGSGWVADLAEPGPQLFWARFFLVVGDADSPGADVHNHLPDAWLAGQVALDVRLALAAGDAGRGQLDGGRFICWHLPGRVPAPPA